jgi:hypothetical protein
MSVVIWLVGRVNCCWSSPAVTVSSKSRWTLNHSLLPFSSASRVLAMWHTSWAILVMIPRAALRRQLLQLKCIACGIHWRKGDTWIHLETARTLEPLAFKKGKGKKINRTASLCAADVCQLPVHTHVAHPYTPSVAMCQYPFILQEVSSSRKSEVLSSCHPLNVTSNICSLTSLHRLHYQCTFITSNSGLLWRDLRRLLKWNVITNISNLCRIEGTWLQIRWSRIRFPALPDFLRSSGSGTGSTEPRQDKRRDTWETK